MMKGSILNYFPGGNTSQGFYSFYKYIISSEEARRIICIKGGPGTGKSSLMKKLGNYFSERGYEIEFHHCSSDNNSLDGVVIKKLRVAIIDGTSPHIVDPQNPGAVDEVLNLGECWREEGFIPFRKNILDTNKEIGKNFKRAYRYLGAARLILEDWAAINEEALDYSKLNLLYEELVKKIFTVKLGPLGSERHLFLTAFTPNGIVTFAEEHNKRCNQVYVLKGGPGTGKSRLMQYLANEAVRRGYRVEVYHSPLIPELIEHIILPDLKIGIMSSNEINNIDLDGNLIFMENYQNLSYLNHSREQMRVDIDNFYALLSRALKSISSAKTLHDELEQYYIPNMDFKRVDSYYEQMLNKLLSYES